MVVSSQTRDILYVCLESFRICAVYHWPIGFTDSNEMGPQSTNQVLACICQEKVKGSAEVEGADGGVQGYGPGMDSAAAQLFATVRSPWWPLFRAPSEMAVESPLTDNHL